MTTPSLNRIAYFGHNRQDTAFVRRIQAFRDAGVDVVTFTFRRDGEPALPGPPWPNVDLGHVEHARLIERIALYLRAIRAVFRHRGTLAAADVVYARNLDIFAFAALALTIARPGRRRTFVYECLDVHEALTRDGRTSRLLRRIERWALRRARLLVVSSPGFLRHYFEPVQGYRGAHFWVENKLYFAGDPAARGKLPCSRASPEAAADAVLTIGWIGIIRCRRTLELLKGLALARPGTVRIRIAGRVSYFLIEDFDEQIDGIANIEYRGAYAWPHELRDVYRHVDVVFAQELSWKGKNSDWLIPNRIYEASYFGVPSLTVGDTETARIVRERGLGFSLADDSLETLLAFVDGLDRAKLSAVSRRLLATPAEAFVTSAADTARLLDAIRAASTRQ